MSFINIEHISINCNDTGVGGSAEESKLDVVTTQIQRLEEKVEKMEEVASRRHELVDHRRVQLTTRQEVLEVKLEEAGQLLESFEEQLAASGRCEPTEAARLAQLEESIGCRISSVEEAVEAALSGQRALFDRRFAEQDRMIQSLEQRLRNVHTGTKSNVKLKEELTPSEQETLLRMTTIFGEGNVSFSSPKISVEDCEQAVVDNGVSGHAGIEGSSLAWMADELDLLQHRCDSSKNYEKVVSGSLARFDEELKTATQRVATVEDNVEILAEVLQGRDVDEHSRNQLNKLAKKAKKKKNRR